MYYLPPPQKISLAQLSSRLLVQPTTARHVYESIFSTPTLLLERTFLRIDVADERTLGRDNCFHSREQAQAKRPRSKAMA